jgi:Fe-S cluster assembly ATP-binding protein
MGPNGTGKSTLAKALAGHEDYDIETGSATMDGKDLLQMDVDERSRDGLFLAFQYPTEIPGVSIANFIRAALNSRQPKGEDIDAVAYYKELYAEMERLGIDRKFTSRSVNEGFSGGEKKRCEILQMAMLQPDYCILDETDSGLDVEMDGRIVKSGDKSLAMEVEERGYDWIKEELTAGV